MKKLPVFILRAMFKMILISMILAINIPRLAANDIVPSQIICPDDIIIETADNLTKVS